MQRAKVGIVVKPRNAKAQELAKRLCEYLVQNKISFLVDSEGLSALSADLITQEQVVARQEIVSRVDYAVILGGDGTLISAARFPAKKPAKIIGVNVGTLGFLTEITAEELLDILEKALEGKVTIEKRPLLEATLFKKNGGKKSYHALNDIVVAKGALARIFGVELKIDNISAASIRGDGVIVSSPSGSTAYSLAAGGSIVHPGVEAMLVTPICPHSLTSRPLIVPASSQIKLQIDPKLAPAGEEVFLTIDGQEGVQIFAEDEIEVRTSAYSVELVTSPSRTYFEMLATKLNWGAGNPKQIEH